MIYVNIVRATGSNVSAVIRGQVRATGASATAVLLDVARTMKPTETIYAPAAMTHCMKAGDIASRGDINSATAPAYMSTRR